MRLAVLSDTHIRAGGTRRLPPRVYRELERADAIVHAGDVVVGEVLQDLARFAPVHAVLGNNDRTLVGELPERLRLELGDVPIAVVHDSGPRAGRERRLRRWFPDARLVVFGHSHVPTLIREDDGRVLLNPGSPTDKRREPSFTMARVDVEGGRVLRPRIVVVDP